MTRKGRRSHLKEDDKAGQNCYGRGRCHSDGDPDEECWAHSGTLKRKRDVSLGRYRARGRSKRLGKAAEMLTLEADPFLWLKTFFIIKVLACFKLFSHLQPLDV